MIHVSLLVACGCCLDTFFLPFHFRMMIVGRGAVLFLFFPNVAFSLRMQSSACRRNMRTMCTTSTTSVIVQEIPLRLPSHLVNARVLTCGDGDMSFSAALTQWGGCKSVVASTWDNEERLFRSFDKAANNVAVILRSGGTVTYGVDATKLCESFSTAPNLMTFDTILWNFPHVVGKQNIKRNRELLQKFLKSCRELYPSSGSTDSDGSGNGHSSKDLVVKIALCGGQSGTRAGTMDEWNHSWQLTHQASEAGWVLTDVERFDAEVMAAFFPGYEVQGHRGHGGSFPLGTGSEMFTFRLPTAATAAVPSSSAVAAVQVPMYIHEVHLLADRLCEDLTWLEGQARRAVVDLIDGSSSCSGIRSVWAVNLVDVYVCPRSSQISHTFQIAYAYHPSEHSSTGLCGGGELEESRRSLEGLDLAVGRTRADEFRVLVERELPRVLDMAPRTVKHGGRVSLAYPWFVAQAVRALNTSETGTANTMNRQHHQQQQQTSVSAQVEDSHGGSSNVVVSIVEVADALRSMEDQDKHHHNTSNDDSTDDCDDDIGDNVNDVVDTFDDSIVVDGNSVDDGARVRSPEEEYIRAVARTLWRRRVGVLIRTAAAGAIALCD